MTTPHPPAPRPEAAAQPQNGLGTSGFVLGLLGLLFSFIPIVGVVAWPLVILGLVLSVLGLRKANQGRASNKGLAIAGVTLSAIGLLVCVLWVAVFSKAGSEMQKQANKESTLVYEVSGDAKGATVTYSSFSDANNAVNQEQISGLPWKKELKVKGLFSGGTLTVMTGQDGGTVTCKITVDGVEKKTATGSGPFGTASCSGF